MRELRKIHDGDLTIQEDTSLHGIINGDVTVPYGQYFSLHGIVNGDIIVEKGGKAKVHGIVNGSVRNRSTVWIYGRVEHLFEDVEATTHVDAKAVITGKDNRLV
ncbi:hypothetical protein [Agrobacterium fabrum]|uniref:hypothetical protein n=1 Tax=Agrobacterium fabrum TaxID=1176649 RepID=UPI002157D845|nr:hypothetical protein [Agrobacterium fabrum]MCR6727679.1 hypothetical protein [Agrobacterium fabrum]